MVAETDGDATSFFVTSVTVSSQADIATATVATKKNFPLISIPPTLQHEAAKPIQSNIANKLYQTPKRTRILEHYSLLVAALFLFLLYFSNGTHYICFIQHCQVFCVR
ncbi:hypothetical protein HY622_01605 [Candidatus Uhrbacteria bacterium]|nr:hypothetical protein [Candidatus Uhrbacteria bacterium]